MWLMTWVFTEELAKLLFSISLSPCHLMEFLFTSAYLPQNSFISRLIASHLPWSRPIDRFDLIICGRTYLRIQFGHDCLSFNHLVDLQNLRWLTPSLASNRVCPIWKTASKYFWHTWNVWVTTSSWQRRIELWVSNAQMVQCQPRTGFFPLLPVGRMDGWVGVLVDPSCKLSFSAKASGWMEVVEVLGRQKYLIIIHRTTSMCTTYVSCQGQCFSGSNLINDKMPRGLQFPSPSTPRWWYGPINQIGMVQYWLGGDWFGGCRNDWERIYFGIRQDLAHARTLSKYGNGIYL